MAHIGCRGACELITARVPLFSAVHLGWVDDVWDAFGMMCESGCLVGWLVPRAVEHKFLLLFEACHLPVCFL
eukprot:1090590-Rhodomonas_salina.6